jgi:hypothetical protein
MGMVATLCLVALYLLWWVTYADTHLDRRFVQLAPGASSEVQGTTLRVLSLTRAERLASTDGGKAKAAMPGATWVVAVLEAQQAEGAADFYCAFQLLGPDGRLWESESALINRALPSCAGSEITPGGPYRFEALFQVPRADADRLIGIAVEDSDSATRVRVLRPAVP